MPDVLPPSGRGEKSINGAVERRVQTSHPGPSNIAPHFSAAGSSASSRGHSSAVPKSKLQQGSAKMASSRRVIKDMQQHGDEACRRLSPSLARGLLSASGDYLCRMSSRCKRQPNAPAVLHSRSMSAEIGAPWWVCQVAMPLDGCCRASAGHHEMECRHASARGKSSSVPAQLLLRAAGRQVIHHHHAACAALFRSGERLKFRPGGSIRYRCQQPERDPSWRKRHRRISPPRFRFAPAEFTGPPGHASAWSAPADGVTRGKRFAFSGAPANPRPDGAPTVGMNKPAGAFLQRPRKRLLSCC